MISGFIAKYGKNRGRVKFLGVLLGVYFKSKIIQAFINKAYRGLFDCLSRKLYGLAGFLLS
jgi:hypothetical protein